MKEASIHITEENLKKVFWELFRNEELGWANDSSPDKFDKLVDNLLKRSKKYSLYSRTLNITDEKTHKKVNKITSSELDYTNTFLRAFYAARRLSHRAGNIKYTEDHPEWPTIKILAGQLKEFATIFQLPVDVASNIFVKHLFEISPKAIINFWPKSFDKVVELYGAKLDIQNDKHQQETENLHKLYRQNLINSVGLSNDYSKNPILYKFFVEASRICKEELKCNIEVFIKAQFEGLAWAGGYPQPAQLITDAARERVIKYAYQNKIKLKEEPKKDTPKMDWKQLKKKK